MSFVFRWDRVALNMNGFMSSLKLDIIVRTRMSFKLAGFEQRMIGSARIIMDGIIPRIVFASQHFATPPAGSEEDRTCTARLFRPHGVGDGRSRGLRDVRTRPSLSAVRPGRLSVRASVHASARPGRDCGRQSAHCRFCRLPPPLAHRLLLRWLRRSPLSPPPLLRLPVPLCSPLSPTLISM